MPQLLLQRSGAPIVGYIYARITHAQLPTTRTQLYADMNV